jgi:hypothetical protein
MSALSIQVPYQIFAASDGTPLENGYVWIGTTNLDPRTNPVNVYFDAALTQVAPNPLRTVNGYVYNAGSPAQLYIDGVNFSIRVEDKKSVLVYSFPSGSGISPNASGVVYNPAGTGAVATTVQAKLRESVSVKDFGAVGDGVTNDQAAFQLAFTAAQTTGSALYIPSGTYILSTAGQNQVLLTGMTNSIKVYGDGPSTVVKMGNNVCTTDFVCMFSLRSSAGVNVEFCDMTINMNAANNPLLGGVVTSLEHCHAIQINSQGTDGFTNVIARNIYIVDPIADGVSIGGSTVLSVGYINVDSVMCKTRTRSRSDVTVTAGYRKLNVANCVTYNVEVEVNIDGARTLPTSYTSFSNCIVSQFDVIIDPVNRHLLVANNLTIDDFFNCDGFNARFNGCYFSTSSLIGITDTSHTSSVFFSGCEFRLNTGYTDAYWFFFGNTANSPDVISFENCRLFSTQTLTNGVFYDRNGGTAYSNRLSIKNCWFEVSNANIFIQCNAKHLEVVGNTFIGLPTNAQAAIIRNENTTVAFQYNITVTGNRCLTSNQVLLYPCNTATTGVNYFLGENYVIDPTKVYYISSYTWTNVTFVTPMSVPVATAPASGQTILGTRYINQSPTAGGFVGTVVTTSGTIGSSAVLKTFGAISA